MLHITTGKGKLEHMNSINVSSLNNPFCIEMSKIEGNVCSKCYSTRLLKCRKALKTKLEKNGELLINNINSYDLPRINAKWFRFNSYGELLNKKHFINLTKIAHKNIHVTFALWTKRIQLVGDYPVPANLILIYSEPRINPKEVWIPPRFNKVFAVYTKDYIKENNIDINCGGKKCITCLKCYSIHNDYNIIREKLK